MAVLRRPVILKGACTDSYKATMEVTFPSRYGLVRSHAALDVSICSSLYVL